MKRFIGTFKDVNEVAFWVFIYADDGRSNTTTENLILADTPVVISMENDENIFKPCKYCSATINIITEEVNFYFVANKITDVRVEICRQNDPEDAGDLSDIFTGYVLPESFNQGFHNTYDEFTLNCIDRLAALKYSKYTRINDGGFVSVIDILKEGLLYKGGLTHIDLPDDLFQYSTYNDLEVESRHFENLFISESNFFNEDGEAWTWAEVIEELMKYLCCTCYIKDGTIANILHYPHLVEANLKTRTRRKYFKTSSNWYDVSAEDQNFELSWYRYNLSDGNVTILPAYNEVKIKSDNYPIDFDEADFTSLEADNITDTNQTTMQSGRILPFTGYLYKITQAINPNNSGKEYWWLTSFYKPKGNVVMQGYNDGASSIDTSIYPTKLNLLNKYIGCSLIGQTVKGAKEDGSNILNYNFTPSLTNYLVLSLIPYQGDYQYYWPTSNDYLLEYVSTTPIVSGPNFYITFDISGKLYAKAQGKYASISTVDERDTFSFDNISNQTSNNYAFGGIDDRLLPLPSNPSLTAMLRFGNYYWNGSGWVTSFATFELPIEEDASKYGSFTNKKTSKFTQNIEGGLYVIPCNASTIMNGTIEFRLLYPKKFENWWYKFAGSTTSWDPSQIIFNKFALAVVNSSASENLNGKNSDSTEYTIVIDDDNISQYNTIEQKICTWDNLAPNYSSMYIGANENDLEYVSKVIFPDFDNNKGFRFEEYGLQMYYGQLNDPQLEYKCTLSGFIEPEKIVKDSQFYFNYDISFVVNGYDYDVRNNRTSVTLMELKNMEKVEISKENTERQFYRTGLIYKANP